MTILQAVPKPERKEKQPKRLQTRTRIKAKNAKRVAKMRKRNFPDRTGHERCLIAEMASALHAAPQSWARCWGPIDPAHVTPRGHGGCNSSKDDVVWLCRGHHNEQEGRSRAFELRYGVDLKAEAARVANGQPLTQDAGAPP